MIALPAYRGKNVGVVGLGKAGEATIAALLEGGAHVFAWDDGEAARSKLASRDHLQLSEPNSWDWANMAAFVLGPGVPFTHPAPHPAVKLARQAGVAIKGDVELLCEAQGAARKIGITGTNGKSTTTTLIGHLLAEAGRNTQVGGNLGTAALSLAPLGEDGIYVIETSSYQLDLLTHARFNVALLLNVTPDHLDRHGDMDGYIAAKMHLFANQRQGDVAVIAVDDEHTQKVAAELEARKTMHVVRVSASQGLADGIVATGGILREMQNGKAVFECDLRNIATLTGRHNWQNAAASFAAVRACGVEAAVIAQAMQSFGGLRHRLEMVGSAKGVRFINDSKATNADATANALAPYEQIYWILGGKPKAGGIESLSEYFPRIRHAFLIGEAEADFAATLEGKVAYTRCGTLEKATHAAAKMAFSEKLKDAVVLLSPACASFDQWKGFEQRGDAFCDYAQAIIAAQGSAAHAV